MIRWKDFDCDLQSTFKDGTAKILETDYKLMNYNVDSNGIRVTIKDGGEDFVFDPVNDSVDGYVLCSNGQTYQAETVGKEGNQAWFIVPPDVYNFPGPCIVSILIVTGTVQCVALAARMSIERIVTLPVLSPTSVVANITTVTALLETLVEAKNAAVAAAIEAEEAAENVGTNLAPAYASGTYAVGDYCTKDGYLYRCNTAISTAEAWTAAHWTQVTAGAEIGDLKSAINDISEPYRNLFYADKNAWAETSASVQYSGNDIILTATSTNTYRTAHIEFDVAGIDYLTISWISKSSTSTGANAASIRYGFVSGDTNTWQGYITTSPTTIDVSNATTVRIGLYVDQASVTQGTTATFTGLQIEYGQNATEFTTKSVTAKDEKARDSIGTLEDEFNAVSESVLSSSKWIRYGDVYKMDELEENGSVVVVPDFINRNVSDNTGEISNVSAKRITNANLIYIPDGASFTTTVTSAIYNPRAFCFDENQAFLGVADAVNTMIAGTRYIRFRIARTDDGNLTPADARSYFTLTINKQTTTMTVDAVTEPGENIVYTANWNETSATIVFSGNNVVLTAVGDGTYKTASTDIDVTDADYVTFSLKSRTTGQGSNVAGIRYGFVSDGTNTWQGYLSAFPATIDVSDVDTLRVGLYVASSSVTSGTSVVFEQLQIEKGDSATPFTKDKTSAIDGKMRSYLPFIAELYSGGGIKTSIPNAVVRSIAHRGDDVIAPQCTAPAYIIARQEGFTVAENDLYLSSDGEFVMWHDSNLNRLGDLVDINGYDIYTYNSGFYYVKNSAVYTWNGSSYISSSVALSSLTRCKGADYSVTTLTLAMLKRIDFGAYKGARFAGTTILTFEEWVLLCKQLGMEIYVDKKLTYTDELLTQAAGIVKKYGMGEFSSWLGLNVRQINLLRETIPGVRVGTLQHPSAEAIATFAEVNTGRGVYFNGDAKNGLTAAAVQLGLNAGFEVETYYVDFGSATEETVLSKIREAVSYGVTGVTIDHYPVNAAYEYLFEI